MRLHSIHDREGSVEVPEGGFCLDLVEIAGNPAPVNYQSIKGGINWLLRVDWSHHGNGTVPVGGLVNEFVRNSTQYILKSSGFHAVILGNEPNHENERPGGVVLEPEHVAWVFSTIRNAVKTQNPQIRFITTPIAPYHAAPTPWREYLHRLLLAIASQGGADGVGIHAYARSMDPSEATSNEKMQPPLQNDYRSFRTYLDALSEVPASMKGLPAYITEFNPIPDWENRNSGIVKAIYNEIKHHNAESNTQKVFSLCLFRWKHYPDQKWGIEDRPEVIKDFREAVAQGEGNQVYIPLAGTGNVPDEANPYPFYIDQEAVQYGVEVIPAAEKQDDAYVWKAIEVQFLNPEESQGRHHFYFDTLDENDVRLTGIEIRVWWPSGMHLILSEAKPGEPYSANYPFSPGKNAFSAHVRGNLPSDSVTGAGMGYDTPSGFNPGIHTSVFVKFKRFAVKKNTETPQQEEIEIIHPVVNPRYRVVTQNFGENPQDYARFGIKGHTGMDFATPVGSLVQAVDFGSVMEAGELTDYGLYIKLKHSWGESLYAHLSKILVAHGEHVSQGEKIALSGNTGNSTGPHLHFAMRVNPYNRNDGWAGFTNPAPYLEDDFVPEEPVKPTNSEVLKAIKQAASEEGIPWQILASMAWAESSFDPLEEGGGLFQITEDTWFDVVEQVQASDIDNPLHNARVAAHYLKWLQNHYDGNIYKAVLAYNFGVGRVDRGETPPPLSKEYVNKVFHGRDLLNTLGVK